MREVLMAAAPAALLFPAVDDFNTGGAGSFTPRRRYTSPDSNCAPLYDVRTVRSAESLSASSSLSLIRTLEGWDIGCRILYH
jgi:hypothetical protein